MRIKQSVCYPLAGMTNLEELFPKLAEIGFVGVDTFWAEEDFDDLAALAKANGLAIASMCGHQGLDVGLNRPEEHDRIEQEICVSIDQAARHGIPGIICFSGNRWEGQSDEEGIEVIAAGLKRVAPYAEKKGVNLNMELLNSKIDHAGYQNDHTAFGVAVCEKVGSPRVKLLYDIYHMQIMEGDVIRSIRDNIQWIGHFHTAGVPDRHDMDDEQELNYVAIARAIAATGYENYVAHEFIPKGDKIAAFAQAFEICDQG